MTEHVIEPGARLLITVGAALSSAEGQRIKDTVQAHFPDTPVTVLAGATGVAVLPPAADPETDTLPQWLAWRFGKHATTATDWADLTEDGRDYWRREAAAVRRAVARGGFKPQPVETPEGLT